MEEGVTHSPGQKYGCYWPDFTVGVNIFFWFLSTSTACVIPMHPSSPPQKKERVRGECGGWWFLFITLTNRSRSKNISFLCFEQLFFPVEIIPALDQEIIRRIHVQVGFALLELLPPPHRPGPSLLTDFSTALFHFHHTHRWDFFRSCRSIRTRKMLLFSVCLSRLTPYNRTSASVLSLSQSSAVMVQRKSRFKI